MTRAPVAPIVGLVCRLALAVILGWAGLAKLIEPLVALQAVQAYELLPESLVPVVGYGLPLLEVALALFLLVGLLTRPVAIAVIVVMLAFIAAVASAWARGLSIDCGCFGGGGQIAPEQTRYVEEILRDLGFILLAGWLVLRPITRWSLDGRYAADHDEATDEGGDEDEDGPIGAEGTEETTAR